MSIRMRWIRFAVIPAATVTTAANEQILDAGAGQKRPCVPWTASQQSVRRLQQRGTPAWDLLADHEGHGVARRENSDHHVTAPVKFTETTQRLEASEKKRVFEDRRPSILCVFDMHKILMIHRAF